jgi:hypothetical protein
MAFQLPRGAIGSSYFAEYDISDFYASFLERLLRP